jgi:tRNA-dihydrouridine synthase C
MLLPDKPALILAPMDGFTDSPMRALQGEVGAFTFAVSEFIRVSTNAMPEKVFLREVPELLNQGRTSTGLPVQVQLLGGDPQLMAESAVNACLAGARAIDINFGCPAPTVNRHDGGASILRFPRRIRDIVSAVREALPKAVPVSAKLRLGWEDIGEIHQTAKMAAEGGAAWLVIHARTKMQRYAPPVFWKSIGRIREELDVPIVANGDLWDMESFQRCREETGCLHYMLGRGALVNPGLGPQIAAELGLIPAESMPVRGWPELLRGLSRHCQDQVESRRDKTLHRLKQWLNLVRRFGRFEHFDEIKKAQNEDDFFRLLSKYHD